MSEQGPRIKVSLSFISCSQVLSLTLSTKFNKLFLFGVLFCFVFWGFFALFFVAFIFFGTFHKHFKHLKNN